MIKGLLARKLGMTQVFKTDGQAVAVTVLETGPCHVVQLKTDGTDGYEAVQLGFLPQKPQRLTKAALNHQKKAGLTTPMQYLREFDYAAEDKLEVGQTITVGEVFAVGDRINASATSKGKGTQGVMRRHNFARKPMSHGCRNHRLPGSIGTNTTPGRTLKGRKMPGHMGDHMVTTRNLEVVEIDGEKNLMLVKGAVPGAVRSLVIIRK